MSDTIPAIESAVRGITTVFLNPAHAKSLRGHLEHIYTEATTSAWRAAMKVAPSEAMLEAAKHAGLYGAYHQDALLVPEEPTAQWVAAQVQERSRKIDTASVRAFCQGEPWLFLNITLVTRDGNEHHLKVATSVTPWPPSREVAEEDLTNQVLVLLNLPRAQVQG